MRDQKEGGREGLSQFLSRANLLCSTKILVSKKITAKSEGGREGLSRFSVKKLCPTVRKNFVEVPFFVPQKLWYRKNLAKREGASITIFRRNILSNSTQSFRRGMLLCFRKFRVSKKLMPKRGISRNSMENLLSHSAESFCRGILLCFRKFRLSKNIMSEREKSRFSIENLLSLCTEKFVVEPISKSLKSGVGNCLLGKVLSRFSGETLSSQCTEKLRRGTLLCSTKNLVFKKIMDKREGESEEEREGLSRSSVKKFCLTLPKNFVAETFCASQNLISGIQKC